MGEPKKSAWFCTPGSGNRDAHRCLSSLTHSDCKSVFVTTNIIAAEYSKSFFPFCCVEINYCFEVSCCCFPLSRCGELVIIVDNSLRGSTCQNYRRSILYWIYLHFRMEVPNLSQIIACALLCYGVHCIPQHSLSGFFIYFLNRLWKIWRGRGKINVGSKDQCRRFRSFYNSCNILQLCFYLYIYFSSFKLSKYNTPWPHSKQHDQDDPGSCTDLRIAQRRGCTALNMLWEEKKVTWCVK